MLSEPQLQGNPLSLDVWLAVLVTRDQKLISWWSWAHPFDLLLQQFCIVHVQNCLAAGQLFIELHAQHQRGVQAEFLDIILGESESASTIPPSKPPPMLLSTEPAAVVWHKNA